MAPTRQPRPSGTTVAPGAGTSRRLVWAAAALLIAALTASLGWYFTERRSAGGPVVLISIDTLRADRLGAYGYAQARTSVLDAFAREAIVFDRAYAHAPQTLPSHASMFTGLLPFEHKVRDNVGFALPEGSTTLAALMRGAGYTTGGFVSAFVLRRETGIAQGFDEFDATFPAMAADRSPAQVQRAGPETLAAADTWLKSLTSNRFFLFFHIYEPHKPYRAPERFSSLAPYDGEVAYADEITGGLLDVLKRRGWYDAATIIVLSDHGEGLGDHIEEEHGLFLYDEVIRVPWMIKLPGARAGARVSERVQHIDLVPTLARLAGFARPKGLSGRDLSGALLNRGRIAPQGIYAEALYPRYHFGWSELLSLTDDRYRYIKAPREELYDLERDPAERTNVIGERPQAAAALRAALDQLVAGRSIDKPSSVSDEDRQRLAALGYVGTQSAARADGASQSLPDPKDKAPLLRAYRQAIEMIGTGRLDESATVLKKILDDDPDMTDVWSQYAAVLGRLNRYADSLDAYKQVIRLQPEEPNGLLGAASMLLGLNRLDEARAHAELAVKHAPAQAHQAIALIEVSRKRDGEAMRQAELAAKAEPGLPMPLFIRGTIEYNSQRYGEALKYLLEARTAYSQRSAQARDLHFMIGDSLARLERYQEAEPFLVAETRLYPQHVRARASLALLYQSMGRPAEAERVLTDLTRDVPTREAYDTVARLWRMFGRPDRAAAADAAASSRFGRR